MDMEVYNSMAEKMGKMGSYQNKKKVLENLDKAGDISGKKDINPIDVLAEEVEKEEEESKGITDYIRNIFKD